MGANPNTISAGIKEVWDDMYQIVHYKQPVFRAFADVAVGDKLKKGDTLHREYINELVSKAMGADGSYSRQALTDTDETLVINQERETSFYIKELDELQNHLPVRAKRATMAANALFLKIDADVLGCYDQAGSVVDDRITGGSTGNGITVTDANIDELFIQAAQKLQEQNVIVDVTARFSGDVKRDKLSVMPTAVLSPQVYAKLLRRLGGKDSELGDKVGVNGHMGRYMGFDLFVSNNLSWSGRLLMGTNPTNGDTILIGSSSTNLVTLTLVSGTPTNPGDVKIGGNAAATLDNIVASINAPGTSVSGTFVALSETDQAKLYNVTAVDGTTYLDIKAVGRSYMYVSETLTAAADVWTAALQQQHLLFGTNDSVSLAIQKTPNLRIKDAPREVVGYDFITWTVYGYKVFHDQAPKLVDVKVAASSFAS